ncbi:cytochrome b562 [Zobellella denitrificans]
MRYISTPSLRFLTLLLFLALPTAQAGQSVNLETTMKNMGLAYKQAHRAEDSDSLLRHLDELAELTDAARQASFPEDKAELFRQGLDEVRAAIDEAQAAVRADDQALARQHLARIDDLRKQYHRERRVSWWRILFG